MNTGYLTDILRWIGLGVSERIGSLPGGREVHAVQGARQITAMLCEMGDVGFERRLSVRFGGFHNNPSEFPHFLGLLSCQPDFLVLHPCKLFRGYPQYFRKLKSFGAVRH